VVIGGGNANLLTDMPPNTRMGDNANAFVGGFRLWASVESSLAPVAVRAAGERLVVDGHEARMQAAAAEFFLQALGGLESHGQFKVALSGGSTPRDLYELLASDATWRKHIPWDRTHIFWGDERHVAPDHPDSNYGPFSASVNASCPASTWFFLAWVPRDTRLRSFQERTPSRKPQPGRLELNW
jgi:hypothetical protein